MLALQQRSFLVPPLVPLVELLPAALEVALLVLSEHLHMRRILVHVMDVNSVAHVPVLRHPVRDAQPPGHTLSRLHLNLVLLLCRQVFDGKSMCPM